MCFARIVNFLNFHYICCFQTDLGRGVVLKVSTHVILYVLWYCVVICVEKLCKYLNHSMFLCRAPQSRARSSSRRSGGGWSCRTGGLEDEGLIICRSLHAECSDQHGGAGEPAGPGSRGQSPQRETGVADSEHRAGRLQRERCTEGWSVQLHHTTSHQHTTTCMP